MPPLPYRVSCPASPFLSHKLSLLLRLFSPFIIFHSIQVSHTLTPLIFRESFLPRPCVVFTFQETAINKSSFSFVEAVFHPPLLSSHHEVNTLILLLPKVLTTCFGPASPFLSSLIPHFRSVLLLVTSPLQQTDVSPPRHRVAVGTGACLTTNKLEAIQKSRGNVRLLTSSTALLLIHRSTMAFSRVILPTLALAAAVLGTSPLQRELRKRLATIEELGSMETNWLTESQRKTPATIPVPVPRSPSSPVPMLHRLPRANYTKATLSSIRQPQALSRSMEFNRLPATSHASMPPS